MSRIHLTLETTNNFNYSDKMIEERALLLHKTFTTSTFKTNEGIDITNMIYLDPRNRHYIS
jgi:hypothetical protein